MRGPVTNRFTGREARLLVRRARTGCLASIDRAGGGAYASLVNLASDVDGAPFLLISRLAWHTQNLLANGRGSLLVAEPPETGDALTGARVTVMGRWAEAGEARLKRRYLARHPEAAMYVDFGDFAFWRLKPEVIHAVAGFGRIETLGAAEVFPPAAEMETLEERAIAHMNDDHADVVRRLAAMEGDWRVAAIDPDGADLSDGRQSQRLAFPEPVYGAEALRLAFITLFNRA